MPMLFTISWDSGRMSNDVLNIFGSAVPLSIVTYGVWVYGTTEISFELFVLYQTLLALLLEIFTELLG